MGRDLDSLTPQVRMFAVLRRRILADDPRRSPKAGDELCSQRYPLIGYVDTGIEDLDLVRTAAPAQDHPFITSDRGMAE